MLPGLPNRNIRDWENNNLAGPSKQLRAWIGSKWSYRVSLMTKMDRQSDYQGSVKGSDGA